MKATDLLRTQHKQVTQLFEKSEKAEPAESREIFEQIAAMLVGHDAIEREIFYPACERQSGLTDVLGEALVEHGLIEFALYEADGARSKKSFPYRMQVLAEVVKHHAKEEETELFSRVEEHMDASVLEDLGRKMEQRFEAATAADFRSPLRSNLEQVLAGALKTRPAAGEASLKTHRPKKHNGRETHAKGG